MRLSELKVIYWVLGIFLMLHVLAVFGTEENHERYIFIVSGIILLIILLGIKERSDLVRKVAVYYFWFTLFVNIILILIVTPYIIFFTVESLDVVSVISEVISVAISFYIIRALVNEPLLSEFTSNNSLNQNGANNAPPGQL